MTTILSKHIKLHFQFTRFMQRQKPEEINTQAEVDIKTLDKENEPIEIWCHFLKIR